MYFYRECIKLIWLGVFIEAALHDLMSVQICYDKVLDIEIYLSFNQCTFIQAK